MLFEDHETGGMIGSHPLKRAIIQTGHFHEPGFHLVGRLVGKGNGQNSFGIKPLVHQVRKFGREGPGLAGPGSRHHQGRGTGMLDSFCLL